MAIMLPSLMKSLLPHRFLFQQRRRFRDRPAVKMKSEVSIVRLLSFFFGGILLANLALMTSAAFRNDAAQPALQAGAVKRGPAAAVAADHTRTATPSTDGRAFSETEGQSATEKDRLPETVVTMIDQGCAAHAREKLMVGLTNYYLQRRLRPGADTDDVADTSSVTALLAGPGDPVAMTSETSCQG
jgi:hypothetical protein